MRKIKYYFYCRFINVWVTACSDSVLLQKNLDTTSILNRNVTSLIGLQLKMRVNNLSILTKKHLNLQQPHLILVS